MPFATDPATDQESGYRPGSPAYRRVVVALFLAGLATFALLYSMQAILPELGRGFGISSAATTWAISVTTGAMALAMLIAGPISDRVGRTPLIHISLTGSAIATLACALAPSWGMLLVLRLLTGFALAGLPAVATAYLREELHPGTQARVAGLYVAATALGGMGGRLLSGWVAELAGWRWGVAALAALVIVDAIVVRLVLPSSRRFVPLGAGLRSVAVRARQALADPALLALYAIGGCSMGALVAVLNVITFRLEARPFLLSVGAASLVFLVYAPGSASSALAGRLADDVGRRTVLPLGCLLGLLGLALTLPSSLPLIVIGLTLFSMGFFAVHGVASGWVPARAHAGGIATAQAASLYLFCYYVGSSVFGGLSGHAWNVGHWPGVVLLAATLLILCGFAGLFLWRTPSLAKPS